MADQADKIHALNEELKKKEALIKELEKALGDRKVSAQPTNFAAPEARATALQANKKNVRREEVSAEAKFLHGQDKFSQEYKKIEIPKSAEVSQIIAGVVEKNVLFQNLKPVEREECVLAFETQNVEAGEAVIVQGEVGEFFYVVESGLLRVLITKEGGMPMELGQIQAGGSFGELALMYNTARAATIEAVDSCKLWRISRTTFKGIHTMHKRQRKAQYEQYLAKVPQLVSLNPKELSKLADAVEEEDFEQGMTLIREGEIGNHFYILAEGEVEYSKQGEGVVGKGVAGDYFGHKALLTEDKRAATVTALTDLTCLTIGRTEFVKLLGSLDELEGRSGTEEVEEHDGENKYHKDIKFQDSARSSRCCASTSVVYLCSRTHVYRSPRFILAQYAQMDEPCRLVLASSMMFDLI